MNIESNFVPYQIALNMKSIGFDEPCLYAWCNKGGWNKYKMIKEPIVQILKTDGNPFGEFFNGKNWNKEIIPNTKNSIQCSAPLYQQCFSWFREKYSLLLDVVMFYDEEQLPLTYKNLQKPKGYFVWDYYDENFSEEKAIKFKSYEEAQLECLVKLIKIVKQKQL